MLFDSHRALQHELLSGKVNRLNGRLRDAERSALLTSTLKDIWSVLRVALSPTDQESGLLEEQLVLQQP